MSKRLATLRLFQSLAAALCLVACSAASPAGTAPPAGEEAGRYLYARHCAGCHRPLEKTLLVGRSASRIRSSLVQYPIMFQLRHLGDEDVAALEAILADPANKGRL